MNKIVQVGILLLLFSQGLKAQDNQLGNWLMYFGTNKISNKISIHTEVQYRNHTIAPVNTEQSLLRTGLNFNVAKNAVFTAGYGYVASHLYESDQTSPESEESRIFQQLIITNKVGIVKFEHRYRYEQRWVNSVYRNRYRYRLMFTVPLNKKTIEKGTLFLGVYDEIFINDKQTVFDRNRLYGALGYQLSSTAGVQVGLMRQNVNGFGKTYLQFALIFNPDLRNKGE